MARIAQIVSTARYLPERVVTNAEIKARLAALSDPKIDPNIVDKYASGTGIMQRFQVPDDWATSDLALPAAVEALKRAGRKPGDVDLIIVGTDTPDYITPDTSVVLQHKIGAKNAGTFDVGCACASFPASLAISSGLIATNAALKTVLVIGVYLMHRLSNPNDPVSFFYGDGAGAAVLEGGDSQGFVGAAFQADGAYASYWGIYAGGTVEPASVEAVKAGRTQVHRIHNFTPDVNEEGWPRLFKRLAAENGFTADEVDQLLFTQINKRSIEIASERCGVPMSKCHTIMEKYGYTGSACIPMALDDAIELGKIKRGDLVVMIGSGVGYNMAAAAIRMTV
jgi:3-oxoacyl-[acyl-carrier-protein] synthase-3